MRQDNFYRLRLYVDAENGNGKYITQMFLTKSSMKGAALLAESILSVVSKDASQIVMETSIGNHGDWVEI